MSCFTNNVVYIIIPTVDITTQMENMMKTSFSADCCSIKKNDVDTKRIFKTKLPVSEVFMSYKWYSHKEILVEIQNTEWL